MAAQVMAQAGVEAATQIYKLLATGPAISHILMNNDIAKI